MAALALLSMRYSMAGTHARPPANCRGLHPTPPEHRPGLLPHPHHLLQSHTGPRAASLASSPVPSNPAVPAPFPPPAPPRRSTARPHAAPTTSPLLASGTLASAPRASPSPSSSCARPRCAPCQQPRLPATMPGPRPSFALVWAGRAVQDQCAPLLRQSSCARVRALPYGSAPACACMLHATRGLLSVPATGCQCALPGVARWGFTWLIAGACLLASPCRPL